MSQEPQRWSGKTIIVTGGALGIGPAVAAEGVARGGRVIGTDICEAGAHKTDERIARGVG